MAAVDLSHDMRRGAPPPPPPPAAARVSPAKLAMADEDLEWRFRVADHAAMHFGAQGYESSGSHVFDESASAKLHDRLRSFSQAEAVKKLRKVDGTLRHMVPGLRAAAARIYATQSRWRVLSVALMVAESAQRASGLVTLVGLLPNAEQAVSAYRRAHNDEEPETGAQLIDWVEMAITPRVVKGKTVGNQIPLWFSKAREACEGYRLDVLRDYVRAGATRWREEKAAERARRALLVG
jgi:hypothetical protein